MKKTFKLYIAAWGLLLALFNLITFIVPAAPDTEKYTSSFWIGYAFIMVAFIGQLVCSAMVFNQDENKEVFYGISLLKTGYAGLVVTFIAGIICMVSAFPYWLSVVICAVVLVLNALAVIKAKVAIDAVSSVDAKVKEKTFFIKSLHIDAETLMARASDETIKVECRKVAEALRYSDPMSSSALASAECQISVKFADLSAAVAENDKEKAAVVAKELLVLIDDRNRKCKLLK